MSEFSNAMGVFHLLDKSNCRKCNDQICLAFSSKVFWEINPWINVQLHAMKYWINK